MIRLSDRTAPDARATDVLRWSSQARILSQQLRCPRQHAHVGCDQRCLVLQRSGHDETVGGVTVHVFQLGGKDADATIQRNFPKASLEQLGAPFCRRKGQHDTPALREHGRLPKADGAHGDLASAPDLFDQAPRDRPESRVIAIHPEQGVGVENDHASAFHSTSSSGSTMSPDISSLGCKPKGDVERPPR